MKTYIVARDNDAHTVGAFKTEDPDEAIVAAWDHLARWNHHNVWTEKSRWYEKNYDVPTEEYLAEWIAQKKKQMRLVAWESGTTRPPRKQ